MRGDDLDLVRKAIKGSERAFRKLVEKYSALVYAAARSVLGNRDQVEDTVQEAFIKIYRGLPGFEGRSKLSTWIYRIARNEALNARARIRDDTMPIDDFFELGTIEESPDEIYRRERSAREMRNLVQGLEAHYREVIELRYLAEKSYNEIAELMDIPVGTVKTYIHRAKLSLRERVTRPARREDAEEKDNDELR
ncbi:MAG: RNA polymerase sigma factor [Candidatus Krumholzibacteriota bacterium]|nr:RNA polymerase sigma factor [Candidatus Krumholzibacteriota bacterium]